MTGTDDWWLWSLVVLIGAAGIGLGIWLDRRAARNRHIRKHGRLK